RMEALAAEIHTNLGRQVEIIAQDLGVPGGAKKVHSAIVKKNLDVALVVNNAGFGWDGEVVDMPEDKSHGMINLNILTLTELCRLFVPDLVARGRGGIINVSSVAGMMPMPQFAVYAATKAYVNSFTL